VPVPRALTRRQRLQYADGAIVYLSHETGFGQIPVVAPSMAAFAARVAAGR